MKNIIALLFVLSFLALGFLGLNYIWKWMAIDYNLVSNIALSIVLIIFILTGLAMVFSSAAKPKSNQSNVGKKD